MPIYEYHCRFCKKTIESWHKITRVPKKMRCPTCGLLAKKILSSGRVHTDGDVKWLSSAVKVLQPEHERPIQTRSEYKRYLKEKGLVCKG